MHLASAKQLPRIGKLLEQHHYLGNLRPVGERLYYIATDAAGEWLGILVFSAAANHLKYRESWIGWSNEQRRRRLSLLTNNSRFLLLSDCSVPNLGSRILRRDDAAVHIAEHGHSNQITSVHTHRRGERNGHCRSRRGRKRTAFGDHRQVAGVEMPVKADSERCRAR